MPTLPFDPDELIEEAFAEASARARPMSAVDIDAELTRSANDIVYFIEHYVKIYDNVRAQWIPFLLWPEQRRALKTLVTEKYVVILKARQLGITWLVLAYYLWKMRFRPIAEILMFSQRKTDAEELLTRIEGMYKELPEWMQLPILKDNTEEFQIENKSRATQSAAAAGGRSRALTNVLIDEGDFVENMARLVTAAKATIDMGNNQMVVVSTANDETPNSYYQRMFNGAVRGDNSWVPIFIPWFAHPDRIKVAFRLTDVSETRLSFEKIVGEPTRLNTGYARDPIRLYNTTRNSFRTVAYRQMVDADGVSFGYNTEGAATDDHMETMPSPDHWHEGDVVIDALWNDDKEREALTNSGVLDAKYKEYPATIAEALALRSLNVRFYPPWLAAVYQMRKSLPIRFAKGGPDLSKVTGLVLYAYPQSGEVYGIGADPAGGVSDGDDAALWVVHAHSKEQIAKLAGKIEPSKFAEMIAVLSKYYNNAPVLFELNNHGHAVRAKLKELGVSMKPGETKKGPSREPGWFTTEWAKTELYDTAAKVIQETIEEANQANSPVAPLIFDAATYGQLSHIDAQSLSAPENEHDDLAMAWVLALQCVNSRHSSMQKERHDLWSRASLPTSPLPSHRTQPLSELEAIELSIARRKRKGAR